jgi:shikimate kinase
MDYKMKHIALIGMSNIRKSYWSDKISKDLGFKRFSCDSMISESLGVSNLSEWMSFPPAEKYYVNSEKYLECEFTVTSNIIASVKNCNEPCVIDTSGSVIYMNANLLSNLKKETTVIYLEATKDHHNFLFEQFNKVPKPLIWGEHTNYFRLLEYRETEYKKLADVTMPFDIHKDKNLTSEQFLSLI